MAGGSQIIINKNGITVITPGKFEAKAGQHLFKSGAEVGVNIKGLPAYESYNEKFQMLLPSVSHVKVLIIKFPMVLMN